MSVKSQRNIYQLKIVLNGAKPPIWRRILVPSDIKLGKLHIALQSVMGWNNSHLHQFISGHTFYDVKNENKYTLNELLKLEKETITYEYDFGDSWEHKIILEKILPYEKGKTLPCCIKGKRACPPEDCGGIWGYRELISTLNDPEHPEYEETIEWLGGEFDSEAFDIAGINERLSRHFR